MTQTFSGHICESLSFNVTARIENRVSAVQAVSNKSEVKCSNSPIVPVVSTAKGQTDALDTAIPAQEQNVRENNQVINCFRFSVDWLK